MRYFGTFEWGQVKPQDVIGFSDGLKAGLHAKCNRLKSTFLQALQHLDTYLQVALCSCSLHIIGKLLHASCAG